MSPLSAPASSPVAESVTWLQYGSHGLFVHFVDDPRPCSPMSDWLVMGASFGITHSPHVPDEHRRVPCAQLT